MSKQFMPDERPDRRLQMLRDHADKTEETKYYKDLSQEELDIKRERLTDNLIKVSDLEDDLNVIKENFKEKMDPLKRETKELLGQVKTGKEQVEGTLFHIADHENSIMETWDEKGDFVSSRRLRPDEKQPKLFPIKTVNE
jgi:phage terminase Nu1 subunit (DNA packaging protein)